MLTIHHLFPSRAERILFLAHELGIEHKVVAIIGIPRHVWRLLT